MAMPRSKIVDPKITPFYHCMAKCVRGSYLCGKNLETKKDYSHRKQWIEDKINFLTEIFAIQVCAYAVMSNHYHLVLFIDLDEALSWDQKTVIHRWEQLFPDDAKKYIHLPPEEQQEKIQLWRNRLMSLSWFMRCLNEDIARRANEEDSCLGRFWAGRFKSQALLDDEALLTTMVYVDLNPIRAGIAEIPEFSDFTSIKERMLFARKELDSNPDSKNNSDIKWDEMNHPKTLMSFISRPEKRSNNSIPCTFSEYLALVDYTSRIQRDDKIGFVQEHLPDIFNRLTVNHQAWNQFYKSISSFSYAIGRFQSLKEFGNSFRKRALKGSALAKNFYST